METWEERRRQRKDWHGIPSPTQTFISFYPRENGVEQGGEEEEVTGIKLTHQGRV